VGDLYRKDFAAKLESIVAVKNRVLAGLNTTGRTDIFLDSRKILDEYTGYAQRLGPMVGDTTGYLLDAVDAGKDILFEGAQGSMLDIDHCTFPFVTSSNSSGVGIPAGAGVPPRCISSVLGVSKAYTTRVGGGPFPTEQDNEAGKQIREVGGEYGTTTGRPRRCGWFDAVAVRYAARLSGADGLCLMKLDVLSALPTINICVAYELDGQRLRHFPSHVDDLRRVRPVYETLPGWQTDIRGVRRLQDLPPAAIRYVSRLTELLHCRLKLISVGADREQTILVDS
jgi:adenylosuccinate synthase